MTAEEDMLETREFLKTIDSLEEFVDSSSNKKLDDDFIICECFCVNVADIKRTQKELDIEKLTASFGLGTGCQSCLKSISSWKEKIF